jgi:hypothetical protein
LEELIREVCQLVTAQFDAEEGSVAESGPSGLGRDAEDGASRLMKDEAYGEAGRDRYIGTTGESAEEAILSACGEGTAMEKAGEYEFRTHRFGTWVLRLPDVECPGYLPLESNFRCFRSSGSLRCFGV